MSRRARMIHSPYTGRPIPQTEATFLRTIFESSLLLQPGGAVRRTIGTVLRMSSESSLIAAARHAGMTLRKRGNFYWIEKPTAALLLHRAV